MFFSVDVAGSIPEEAHQKRGKDSDDHEDINAGFFVNNMRYEKMHYGIENGPCRSKLN